MFECFPDVQAKFKIACMWKDRRMTDVLMDLMKAYTKEVQEEIMLHNREK